MAKEKIKLLVVDDNPKVVWMLREGLGEDEYEIIDAPNGKVGIQKMIDEQPQVIILDIKLPGMDGMEVLERVRSINRRVEIVMLSGYGETKQIVRAMKLGAADFISKPFDVEEVEIVIRSVLEKSELKKEVLHLRSELEAKRELDNFVGDSPQILEIKSMIEQVADSELTVLIRGESGTGKEVVARALHRLSSRRKGAFVKVNCAALPRELLEAELFGHEKGAFTGAIKKKPGRFELASRGTIFLDEIGEMSPDLQAKLLQVLEHREFMRVGGIETIQVDVRILCATNRDLETALAQGRIREDLFYRLNEITLFLPVLRERKEDVPLLVEHMLRLYCQKYNREYHAFSRRNMELLQEYGWPGNVRELENLIKQIVVRGDESIIARAVEQRNTSLPAAAPESLPYLESSSEGENVSLKDATQKAVQKTEKVLIKSALNKTNWNRKKAARLLKISYRSLLYKIKDYQIS
ncbi:sigma-54-dependent Fis family transcriptional regulator [bacterium]|nr:sigma-54-dependent Fis family transcriptional regulator [bacterium]